MTNAEKASRRLVDPELLQALDKLPDYIVSSGRLADIRAERAAAAPPLASLADAQIMREEVWVPGTPGAPDVRLILTRQRAATQPQPLLLFIHGGGFVFGTAEGTGISDMRLARATGCAVASVDYRLAPETRAPGQVEDCYAALAWCHREAGSLSFDPERMAVGGISAGGGLAANLALMVRDRNEMTLRLQMLFCPILDDQTAARPVPAHLGEFVWTPQTNAFGWTALTGGEPGHTEILPYTVAARAADLQGVAPAFIDVGALDLLVLESLAFASRLIESAVPTELHVHPGAYHGYELLPGVLVAERAHRLRAEALSRAFEVPSGRG
jgi:triacylglycerol lipase